MQSCNHSLLQLHEQCRDKLGNRFTISEPVGYPPRLNARDIPDQRLNPQGSLAKGMCIKLNMVAGITHFSETLCLTHRVLFTLQNLYNRYIQHRVHDHSYRQEFLQLFTVLCRVELHTIQPCLLHEYLHLCGCVYLCLLYHTYVHMHFCLYPSRAIGGHEFNQDPTMVVNIVCKFWRLTIRVNT